MMIKHDLTFLYGYVLALGGLSCCMRITFTLLTFNRNHDLSLTLTKVLSKPNHTWGNKCNTSYSRNNIAKEHKTGRDDDPFKMYLEEHISSL